MRVVTGLVRFSYVNIFKPKDFGNGDPKYSMLVLIPKDDKKTVSKINSAIKAAIEDGISSKWGGKKPSNLRTPLRDGDEEKEEPEYEGMYFLNAKSSTRPRVVDKDLTDILDPEEVYSGCWGRVALSFYPYDFNGNRGVGVGLENVQKRKDGEHLGGKRVSADDDFGDGFEDDDDGGDDF